MPALREFLDLRDDVMWGPFPANASYQETAEVLPDRAELRVVEKCRSFMRSLPYYGIIRIRR